MILILFLWLVIGVEICFRPRLDKTDNGNILLWYGKEKRKYFLII